MSMNTESLLARLSAAAARLGERVPQVEFRWLGGLKTIAGRLTFYRGMLSFLMLIPAAWQLSPFIQNIFPTVWLFTAFLFVCLAIAAVLEYGVIYPSQIRFNKAQSAKNDRDPIYQRARQADEKTEEILERLDEIERHLDMDSSEDDHP